MAAVRRSFRYSIIFGHSSSINSCGRPNNSTGLSIVPEQYPFSRRSLPGLLTLGLNIVGLTSHRPRCLLFFAIIYIYTYMSFVYTHIYIFIYVKIQSTDSYFHKINNRNRHLVREIFQLTFLMSVYIVVLMI